MRKFEEFTKVTWLVMVEPSFKPVSCWFLKALLKTEGYPCSAGAVAGRHLLHLFQQHTHEESPLQLTTVQARELRPVWLSEVKVTQSCPTLATHGLYGPWNSPGQNTGVGSHSLLQGIFSTKGSKPGLLHCRQTLYQLSHEESPRILEWVAFSFSSGSSWPRSQTRDSCIAGEFFTSWTSRETL